jgi:hypothetical protein
VQVSSTQLLLNTTYGETKSSKIESGIYATLLAKLTGSFDALAQPSSVSTLLDLSTTEPSGLTMFDALANSYGVDSATTNLLSAYEKSL